VMKHEKKSLINKYGVGYTDIFPEAGLQIQILQGKVKDTFDFDKIRTYLGTENWNQISTVTKTDVTKLLGSAEADKCFALALVSSEIGEPLVDIRPITKKSMGN